MTFIPLASTGGGTGGGFSSNQSITPIQMNSSATDIPSSSPIALIHNTTKILPTQSQILPDTTTKNQKTIYTLPTTLTDYICPKIVQVYTGSQIQSTDIPENEFSDDIRAMIMFRGFEIDETTKNQVLRVQDANGIVLNDTAYEPGRNITRAEYIKMLVRALSCRYSYMGVDSGFDDVDTTAWHAPYITFAAKNGWINGFDDGKFYPNQSITRAEAAKILANAIRLSVTTYMSSSFSDVETGSEFSPYIETLKKNNILSGKTKKLYKPNENISRTEVARLIYRTFLG